MESNYEVYLKTDLSRYIWGWAAICDKGVVAIGDNAKDVYYESQKKYPDKKVLLVKVPDKETMLF